MSGVVLGADGGAGVGVDVGGAEVFVGAGVVEVLAYGAAVGGDAEEGFTVVVAFFFVQRVWHLRRVKSQEVNLDALVFVRISWK